VEFRVLGPLEVLDGGRPVPIPGIRERALLTFLLLHAEVVVPFERLLDELWGAEPPETARKSLQVRVSALRKALGDDVLVTHGAGYVIRLGKGRLDLHLFERGLERGRRALEATRYAEATAMLQETLALWRGAPLQDFTYESFAQAAIHRLEELRLVALESRIEADLELGRDAELVPELESLVAEHPLRDHLRGQLMLALYRSGRQADALVVYQDGRRSLVDELGIEPGPSLRRLERAILGHDADLLPASARALSRVILVGGSSATALCALLAIAEPLARRPEHELVLTRTVAAATELAGAAAEVESERRAVESRGVVARAAAFVASPAAGADLVRIAREQDVDLFVLDAPQELLADETVRAILGSAPCDVALVSGSGLEDGGPVAVPFAGTEDDWAALELGAWLAAALDAPLRLAGPAEDGKDSSRLLASASLAVQRAVGVSAEPMLVEPDPDMLLEACRDARVVIVGLPTRWWHEGLGVTRRALVDRRSSMTILARRGARPGGLASPAGETRFTWTIGPGLA